jgi:multiple sugar transport system substrate-binding protein
MGKADLTRRGFMKIAGIGALILGGIPSFPKKSLADNEVSWLMHPVHYDQMGKGELLEKMAAEIGIKVKATQMPFPQYREKLAILLRQDSSDFDIVGFSNSWWDGSLNDFLEPLNGLMKKKPLIDEADILSLDGYKVGDLNYAVPYRIGPMVLHYRKDIYKKYGLKVPKTLEEYKANAKFITQKESGVYGASIMGEQSFFSLWDFNTYLFSFGGAYFDDANLKKAKVILNNQKGLDALKYWVSLKEENVLPPGVLNATWDTFITNMQQGKIAQGINWSVYIGAVNDPQKSKVAGLLDWAEPPYAAGSGLSCGVTASSGWGLYIPKASQKKELAWEVIRYITSPKSDLYMGLHGGGPFRASTFSSPEYKKFTLATDVIRTALQNSAPMWRPVGAIRNASEVVDKVVIETASALAGKKTPKEAMDQAAEIVRTIVLG